MPRPRLTDAEREAKRRERSRHSFSDASYKHYDPIKEGYGSQEEWIAAAEALALGRGILHERRSGKNPDLDLLNLTEMPDNIVDLKRAFRNAIFITHPDYGGTNEVCRQTLEAFDRLSKFY